MKGYDLADHYIDQRAYGVNIKLNIYMFVCILMLEYGTIPEGSDPYREPNPQLRMVPS